MQRTVRTTLLIVFGAVIFIGPFIAISAYNNPSGDDFGWLQHIRDDGILQHTKSNYQTWTGRYALAFNYLLLWPMIYGDNFTVYKIVPAVFIVLLWFAVFRLIKQLFKSASKQETLLMSVIFLVLYLAYLPSPSEGLYWFSGSANYLFPAALSLLIVGLILQLGGTKRRSHKILLGVLISVLIVLACGANEMNVLVTVATLLIWFVVSYFRRQTNKYFLLAFLLIALACMLVSLLAPGNAIRLASSSRDSLPSALYDSLTGTVKFVNAHITLPLILLTMVFYWFYRRYRSRGQSIFAFRIHPIAAFSLWFFVLFAGRLIGYLTSAGIAGRMLDVLYLMFLLGWFLNFIIIVEYLKGANGASVTDQASASVAAGNPNLLLTLSVIIVATLVFSTNITGVYRDLVTKTASRYDAQLNERYRRIRNTAHPQSTIVEVPALTHKPATLYYTDLAGERNWRNVTQARYFQIQGLRLVR